MNKYTQKIKELRTEKELSQEQVALAIGVSRPTYAAIESGKQSLNLEQAKELTKLFGIDIDSFLSGMVPNFDKYKQMILSYLRMNLSEDEKVTKTKLAKMLYLADFAWFYEKSESMSGMQYRKITYGPVPDSYFRAIEELEQDGKIEITVKTDDEKTMYLIKESDSNKNEQINFLSKEELSLMKKIANKWRDKKTKDIVNFTHNQLPYFLCRDNEVIPYELITQEDPDKVY